MSSTRNTQNWISAALSAAYLVVYLFAPFYQVALLSVPLNGVHLIGFNALAILPVLLGVVMAIGACLFPPLAAVITEGITLLTTIVFMLMHNSFVTSLLSAAGELSADWAVPVGSVITSIANVVPGWGAIVCLVLCVAALVVDVISNWRPKEQPTPEDLPPDWCKEFSGDNDIPTNPTDSSFSSSNNDLTRLI